jgi:hypothetical protein
MRKAVTLKATSNDFHELRRTAVENVTEIVHRQRKTNAIIGKWLAAKEASKKCSLRK